MNEPEDDVFAAYVKQKKSSTSAKEPTYTRGQKLVGGIVDGVVTSLKGDAREKGRRHGDGSISTVDIAAPKGTPVKWERDEPGEVVFAGKKGGYGNLVEVKVGDKKRRLAHLDVINVKVGDTVGKGVEIGRVGNTGRVRKSPGGDGSHLHDEWRNITPASTGPKNGSQSDTPLKNDVFANYVAQRKATTPAEAPKMLDLPPGFTDVPYSEGPLDAETSDLRQRVERGASARVMRSQDFVGDRKNERLKSFLGLEHQYPRGLVEQGPKIPFTKDPVARPAGRTAPKAVAPVGQGSLRGATPPPAGATLPLPNVDPRDPRAPRPDFGTPEPPVAPPQAQTALPQADRRAMQPDFSDQSASLATPPVPFVRDGAPQTGAGGVFASGRIGEAPIPVPMVPGNIDLTNRPVVRNEDGSVSTVRSISINQDGREILIPTVIDGQVVSNEEAIDAFHRTGQHLGVFANAEDANAYAEKLHEQQQAMYAPVPDPREAQADWGDVNAPRPELPMPNVDPNDPRAMRDDGSSSFKQPGSLEAIMDGAPLPQPDAEGRLPFQNGRFSGTEYSDIESGLGVQSMPTDISGVLPAIEAHSVYLSPPNEQGTRRLRIPVPTDPKLLTRDYLERFAAQHAVGVDPESFVKLREKGTLPIVPTLPTADGGQIPIPDDATLQRMYAEAQTTKSAKHRRIAELEGANSRGNISVEEKAQLADLKAWEANGAVGQAEGPDGSLVNLLDAGGNYQMDLTAQAIESARRIAGTPGEMPAMYDPYEPLPFQLLTPAEKAFQPTAEVISQATGHPIRSTSAPFTAPLNAFFSGSERQMQEYEALTGKTREELVPVLDSNKVRTIFNLGTGIVRGASFGQIEAPHLEGLPGRPYALLANKAGQTGETIGESAWFFVPAGRAVEVVANGRKLARGLTWLVGEERAIKMLASPIGREMATSALLLGGTEAAKGMKEGESFTAYGKRVGVGAFTGAVFPMVRKMLPAGLNETVKSSLTFAIVKNVVPKVFGGESQKLPIFNDPELDQIANWGLDLLEGAVFHKGMEVGGRPSRSTYDLKSYEKVGDKWVPDLSGFRPLGDHGRLITTTQRDGTVLRGTFDPVTGKWKEVTEKEWKSWGEPESDFAVTADHFRDMFPHGEMGVRSDLTRRSRRWAEGYFRGAEPSGPDVLKADEKVDYIPTKMEPDLAAFSEAAPGSRTLADSTGRMISPKTLRERTPAPELTVPTSSEGQKQAQAEMEAAIRGISLDEASGGRGQIFEPTLGPAPSGGGGGRSATTERLYTRDENGNLRPRDDVESSGFPADSPLSRMYEVDAKTGAFTPKVYEPGEALPPRVARFYEMDKDGNLVPKANVAPTGAITGPLSRFYKKDKSGNLKPLSVDEQLSKALDRESASAEAVTRASKVIDLHERINARRDSLLAHRANIEEALQSNDEETLQEAQRQQVSIANEINDLDFALKHSLGLGEDEELPDDATERLATYRDRITALNERDKADVERLRARRNAPKQWAFNPSTAEIPEPAPRPPVNYQVPLTPANIEAARTRLAQLDEKIAGLGAKIQQEGGKNARLDLRKQHEKLITQRAKLAARLEQPSGTQPDIEAPTQPDLVTSATPEAEAAPDSAPPISPPVAPPAAPKPQTPRIFNPGRDIPGYMERFHPDSTKSFKKMRGMQVGKIASRLNRSKANWLSAMVFNEANGQEGEILRNLEQMGIAQKAWDAKGEVYWAAAGKPLPGTLTQDEKAFGENGDQAPQPGTFGERPAEEDSISLPHPKYPTPLAKIKVGKFANGWSAVTDFMLPTGGHSTPLTSTFDMNLHATKDEAVQAALVRLKDEVEKFLARNKKPADQKEGAKILKWIASQQKAAPASTPEQEASSDVAKHEEIVNNLIALYNKYEPDTPLDEDLLRGNLKDKSLIDLEKLFIKVKAQYEKEDTKKKDTADTEGLSAEDRALVIDDIIESLALPKGYDTKPMRANLESYSDEQLLRTLKENLAKAKGPTAKRKDAADDGEKNYLTALAGLRELNGNLSRSRDLGEARIGNLKKQHGLKVEKKPDVLSDAQVRRGENPGTTYTITIPRPSGDGVFQVRWEPTPVDQFNGVGARPTINDGRWGQVNEITGKEQTQQQTLPKIGDTRPVKGKMARVIATMRAKDSDVILYAATDGSAAFIRMVSRDSGEEFMVREFPTLEKARAAYTKAIESNKATGTFESSEEESEAASKPVAAPEPQGGKQGNPQAAYAQLARTIFRETRPSMTQTAMAESPLAPILQALHENTSMSLGELYKAFDRKWNSGKLLDYIDQAIAADMVDFSVEDDEKQYSLSVDALEILDRFNEPIPAAETKPVPAKSPYGWQDWEKYESHPGFIYWATPNPRLEGHTSGSLGSRFAVWNDGNHIVWRKYSPNTTDGVDDRPYEQSSGAFYKDENGSATENAARAARQKRKEIEARELKPAPKPQQAKPSATVDMAAAEKALAEAAEIVKAEGKIDVADAIAILKGRRKGGSGSGMASDLRPGESRVASILDDFDLLLAIAVGTVQGGTTVLSDWTSEFLDTITTHMGEDYADEVWPFVPMIYRQAKSIVDAETVDNPEVSTETIEQAATKEATDESATVGTDGDTEGRVPVAVPGAGEEGDAERPDVEAGSDTVADGSGDVQSDGEEGNETGTGVAGSEGDREGATAGVDSADSGSGSRTGHGLTSIRGGSMFRAQETGISEWLQSSSPTEKFDANLAAIDVARELSSVDRAPTPEQQLILAKWTGWGQFKNVFTPENEQGNNKLARQIAELKKRISPEEFASLRSSSANAHYTDPRIIEAMWDYVRRAGFAGGRILEPAVGSGNFLGWMPTDLLNNSKIVAVELDVLTAQIANLLYPQANVWNNGYQDVNIKPDTFDLVISNVPFGDYTVYDKETSRFFSEPKPMMIHNYYFARSLNVVKPGGLVVFITSTGTMDAKDNQAFRQKVDAFAEFVGAVRLPGDAFLKNAGTGVTTDIIILRKRGGKNTTTLPGAKEWLGKPIKLWDGPSDMNWWEKGESFYGHPYYKTHPGNVLGKWANSTLYGGNRLGVDSKRGQDTLALLNGRLAGFPADIFAATKSEGADPLVEGTKATAELDVQRVGRYSLQPNKSGALVLHIHTAKGPVVATVPKAAEPRIRSFIKVRDALERVFETQKNREMDPVKDLARKQLRDAYDAFYKTHGRLSDPKIYRSLNDDPSLPIVASLEDVDNDGNITADAAAFTRDVIFHYEAPTSADSVEDAVRISILEYETINTKRVGDLLGISKIAARLRIIEEGAGFEDPVTGRIEPPEEYLSGQIGDKIRAAEKKARLDKSYQRNVDALKAVLPKPKSIKDVASQTRLGATFVDKDIIEAFAKEELGVEIDVLVDPVTATWGVEHRVTRDDSLRTGLFGLNQAPSEWVLRHALNGQRPLVTYRTKDGTFTDIEATTRAEQKIVDMQKRFEAWLSEDPARGNRVATNFNRRFNEYRRRTFSTEPIQVLGVAPEVLAMLRPYQNSAARQIGAGFNMLAAHEPGAGKTLTSAVGMGIMLSRGIAKKIAFAALPSTVTQIEREIRRALPSANILMADKGSMDPKKRAAFLGRIATSAPDIVIIPHTSLVKIPARPEAYKALFKENVIMMLDAIVALDEDVMGTVANVLRQVNSTAITALFNEIIEERGYADKRGNRTEDVSVFVGRKGSKARGGGGRGNQATKMIERQLKKMIEQMKKKLDRAQERINKKDSSIYWEDLGFDAIVVDESHNFKSLPYASRMGRISGVGGGQNSDKAEDLYVKAMDVNRRRKGDRGVTFLTGTPVTNTLGELYTIMRYLSPTLLKDIGMESFDAWAGTFARVQSRLEPVMGGQFRMKARFTKFVNGIQLSTLVSTFADIQTADMLQLPKPRIAGGKPKPNKVKMQEWTYEYILHILDRITGIKDQHPKNQPGEDCMPAVTSDSRLYGLDIRLVIGDNQRNFGLKEFKRPETLAAMEEARRTNDPTGKVGWARHPLHRGSKAEAMGENMFRIYQEGNDRKTTQVMFADYGLPDKKKPGAFNFYDGLRDDLISRGVPASEIAYYNDYKDTPDRQKLLFDKFNAGEIRILFGNTQSLGTGTNIQRRVAAIHYGTTPYRPTDLQQSNARGIRQGNIHIEWDEEVEIHHYIMGGMKQIASIDAWAWNLVARKIGFIDQFWNGGLDELEDITERDYTEDEFTAIAMDNPLMTEKVALERDYATLTGAFKNWEAEQHEIARKIADNERDIDHSTKLIARLKDTAPQVVAIQKEGAIPSERYPFMIGGEGPLTVKQAADLLSSPEHASKFDERSGWLPILRVGPFQVSVAAVMPRIDFERDGRNIKDDKTIAFKVVGPNGETKTTPEYNDHDHTMHEIATNGLMYITRFLDELAAPEEQIATLEGQIARDKKANVGFRKQQTDEFPDADELSRIRTRLHEIEFEMGLATSDVGTSGSDLTALIAALDGMFPSKPTKADRLRAIQEYSDLEDVANMSRADLVAALGEELELTLTDNQKKAIIDWLDGVHTLTPDVDPADGFALEPKPRRPKVDPEVTREKDVARLEKLRERLGREVSESFDYEIRREAVNKAFALGVDATMVDKTKDAAKLLAEKMGDTSPEAVEYVEDWLNGDDDRHIYDDYFDDIDYTGIFTEDHQTNIVTMLGEITKSTDEAARQSALAKELRVPATTPIPTLVTMAAEKFEAGTFEEPIRMMVEDWLVGLDIENTDYTDIGDDTGEPGSLGSGNREVHDGDKYFSEKAWKLTDFNPKSSEYLIHMSPDEFLRMAPPLPNGEIPGKASDINALLERGGQFGDLPFLYFKHDGMGTATVSEGNHEGRHRAIALRRAGVKSMPVLLISDAGGDGQKIRWGSQEEGNHDRIEGRWPQILKGDGANRIHRIPFPVPDLRVSGESSSKGATTFNLTENGVEAGEAGRTPRRTGTNMLLTPSNSKEMAGAVKLAGLPWHGRTAVDKKEMDDILLDVYSDVPAWGVAGVHYREPHYDWEAPTIFVTTKHMLDLYNLIEQKKGLHRVRDLNFGGISYSLRKTDFFHSLDYFAMQANIRSRDEDEVPSDWEKIQEILITAVGDARQTSGSVNFVVTDRPDYRFGGTMVTSRAMVAEIYRHEQSHAVQRYLAKVFKALERKKAPSAIRSSGETAYIPEHFIDSVPGIDKVLDRLMTPGSVYENYSKRGMAMEVFSHLLTSNDVGYLGLTQFEAMQMLRHFYDAILERHGEAGLEMFIQYATPAAREATSEKTQEIAEARARERADARKRSEASEGVSRRKRWEKGSVLDGVQKPGEGSDSGAEESLASGVQPPPADAQMDPIRKVQKASENPTVRERIHKAIDAMSKPKDYGTYLLNLGAQTDKLVMKSMAQNGIMPPSANPTAVNNIAFGGAAGMVEATLLDYGDVWKRARKAHLEEHLERLLNLKGYRRAYVTKREHVADTILSFAEYAVDNMPHKVWDQLHRDGIISDAERRYIQGVASSRAKTTQNPSINTPIPTNLVNLIWDHISQKMWESSARYRMSPKGYVDFMERRAKDRKEVANTKNRMRTGAIVPKNILEKQIPHKIQALKRTLTAKQLAQLEEMEKAVYEINRQMWDLAHSVGIISSKVYKRTTDRGDEYIPLSRIMDSLGAGKQRNKYHRQGLDLAQQEILYKLEGSERINVPPIIASMARAAETIREAARNHAARTFINLRHRDPVLASTIFQLKDGQEPADGYAALNVYIDGKKTQWQVPDFVEWEMGLATAQQVELIGGAAINFFNHMFKSGATGMNLAFALPNLARDVRDYTRFAEHAPRVYRPDQMATFALQWGASFYRVIRKNGAYREWLRSGGAFSTLQKQLTPNAFLNGMLYQAAQSPWRVLAAPYLAVGKFVNAIEESTKLTAYKRALSANRRDGMSEADSVVAAVYESRAFGGSPDFAIGGSYGQQVNLLYPFFRASLAGIRRNVRWGIGRDMYMPGARGGIGNTGGLPPRTPLNQLSSMVGGSFGRGGGDGGGGVWAPILGTPDANKNATVMNSRRHVAALMRFAMHAFWMALAAMSYYEFHLKDYEDDYEDVLRSDREKNWIFFKPYTQVDAKGKTYRPYDKVPMSHFDQLFFPVILDVLRWAKGKDVDMTDTARREAEMFSPLTVNSKPDEPLLRSLARAAVSNASPILREPVEQGMNWDTFRDIPIESPWMEKVDPTRRKTAKTSVVAVTLAEYGDALIRRFSGQPKNLFFNSPVRIQRFINSITGGASELPLGIIDAMNENRAPDESAEDRLRSMPVIGPLVRRFIGSAKSQRELDATERFYNAYRMSDAGINTFRHDGREYGVEAARKFLEKPENFLRAAFAGELDDMVAAQSEIRKGYNLIADNPDLSQDVKLEALRKLNEQETALLKRSDEINRLMRSGDIEKAANDLTVLTFRYNSEVELEKFRLLEEVTSSPAFRAIADPRAQGEIIKKLERKVDAMRLSRIDPEKDERKQSKALERDQKNFELLREGRVQDGDRKRDLYDWLFDE